MVEDKVSTLSHYRFCFCFENEAAEGYITEKIFDCLLAGTAPVYFGAPNITDYVQHGAFIDMRSFEGFTDLLTYLQSISSSELANFQEAGQQFLRSPEFEPWKPRSVFGQMVSGVEG